MWLKLRTKHSFEGIIGNYNIHVTIVHNSLETGGTAPKKQLNTLHRQRDITLPNQRTMTPTLIPEPIFSKEAITLIKYILIAMTIIYAMQGNMDIAELLREILIGL